MTENAEIFLDLAKRTVIFILVGTFLAWLATT